MRLLRGILAATVVLGAVSLAGCAGNPDLGPLESQLSEVEGVNGAMAWPTHSGAPWNTQVNLLLFVEDPSEEGLVDAVRAAAPVLAGDSAAGRHEVSIGFVEGDPANYEDRFAAFRDQALFSAAVAETLGGRDLGGEMIVLTPDDVRRLADGS
jgi:hypothetical protein